MGEDLVLLHGFSQTHRAFDGVIAALPGERYRPLAPDLPGHGAAADSRAISFASCVAGLADLAPPSFVLCGYSQGGRIALHLALAHPERVSRLVLISTTAGIDDPSARASRLAADEALAARIERQPLEDFVTRWREQPLFAGEPAGVRAAAMADQLRNSTSGLAAALRGLGTGAMQPVWERLDELTMPVTVLAGERDSKFLVLGRRLADELPDGRLEVVAGAGHGLLLEAPGEVADALMSAGNMSAGPTPEERLELRQAILALRAQVAALAPPEQRAQALERIGELDEAITAGEPDVTTMRYVRGWFAKNLPGLAGAVVGVVVHPVVGKLVEAAGDAAVGQFKQLLEDA